MIRYAPQLLLAKTAEDLTRKLPKYGYQYGAR
jgi:hypothetical protein